MRGDDQNLGTGPLAGMGTPPRARGRLSVLVRTYPPYRNTPACAGTTSRWVWGGAPPRGTPPRARGRRRPGQRAGRGLGNTPACAGTTASSSWRPRPRSEHPRVRGDDLALGVTPNRLLGTPPRARGRLRCGLRPGCGCGNTPACAGTTDGRLVRGRIAKEHPRVRGDDPGAPSVGSAARGTPPRARGRRTAKTPPS